MARKTVYERYKERQKRQRIKMKSPQYKKKMKFLKQMGAEARKNAKASGVKLNSVKKKPCGCGRKKSK